MPPAVLLLIAQVRDGKRARGRQQNEHVRVTTGRHLFPEVRKLSEPAPGFRQKPRTFPAEIALALGNARNHRAAAMSHEARRHSEARSLRVPFPRPCYRSREPRYARDAFRFAQPNPPKQSRVLLPTLPLLDHTDATLPHGRAETHASSQFFCVVVPLIF